MGSGPVTTSAKTRRREYTYAHADHQVDASPSCKHLCCREGVDKARKAPKGSFISAASSVNSLLSGHKGKNGCVAITKKSTAPSVSISESEAEIEIVDLASRQTFGAYEKTPLKAFRSLNRLHDNVTKGRSAPVAIKKQRPSFDYMKRGQPQISFLNKDASAGKLSAKSSIDNDADWMGELPSPSALLEKPRETPGPLRDHTSTEYGSSWPNGLSSPFALIRQNDVGAENHPDNG